MQFVSIACALGIAATSIGCTVMCPAQPAALQPPPPALTSGPPEHAAASAPHHVDPPNAARHMYKLDFTIAGASSGQAPGGGVFTMNLEEGRTGEIMAGSNVPLAPGGTSRTDVGIKIKANYAVAGDDLLLESSAEMSAADDPTGIHKLNTSGQAMVTPGKPALIASIDDPQGKKRYQLTVAATKLR